MTLSSDFRTTRWVNYRRASRDETYLSPKRLRHLHHVSRSGNKYSSVHCLPELIFCLLPKLYGPLNQLGFIYRNINTSLVDTERLMKLLAEPTDVNDKPGAPDLIVNDGEIEFGKR